MRQGWEDKISMKSKIPNYIRFIIFLSAYFLYVKYYSLHVTESWASGGDIDLILIPFIFGFSMYSMLRDDDIIRLIYLFFVPVIVQLALIGEGDPSKPGIEYYFVIYITINFTVGGVSAMAISKLAGKLLKKEKS